MTSIDSLSRRVRELEESGSESDRDGETPPWVPFDRETDLELSDEDRRILEREFNVEPDTGLIEKGEDTL